MGIAGVLVAITLGCLFATGPTAAWRHSGIGAARTRVPADNVNQHPELVKQPAPFI
jgi:hypothetical protein